MENNELQLSDIENEVVEWSNEYEANKEKYELQERFRQEYLGNVSHELKTPIFNIQCYLDAIVDGTIKDEETIKKFLTKASQNVERLNEIVQSLLSLNKYEQENFSLDIKSFDICQLIKTEIQYLDELAKRKHQKIQFKDGCDKVFMVTADAKAISEVIVNLLVNAIKYSPDNTTIFVGLYSMNKNVLIEIIDEGDGIAPEHLSRLFERFYRVDEHRNRNIGGTGLGLSICKHIIEAHHQSIHVRSKLGMGSTFGFSLAKAE